LASEYSIWSDNVLSLATLLGLDQGWSPFEYEFMGHLQFRGVREE
jgi:hypothetical protein